MSPFTKPICSYLDLYRLNVELSRWKGTVINFDIYEREPNAIMNDKTEQEQAVLMEKVITKMTSNHT